MLFCFFVPCSAESLKITSNPPGASVELDGVLVGPTPFEKSFPGGYFHHTHTTIGQRLEHPFVARVSLAGYATREILLADGPIKWSDLHGHNHSQYWLFKSDHFMLTSTPLLLPLRARSLHQTPRHLPPYGQSYPWKKLSAAPSLLLSV